MKPQATAKQIQNIKFRFKFHPFNYIQEHAVLNKEY